jgi:hypothetical protein
MTSGGTAKDCIFVYFSSTLSFSRPLSLALTSSTDDGDAALACQLSKGSCDAVGTLGEGIELEDAHGSVPDN